MPTLQSTIFCCALLSSVSIVPIFAQETRPDRSPAPVNVQPDAQPVRPQRQAPILRLGTAELRSMARNDAVPQGLSTSERTVVSQVIQSLHQDDRAAAESAWKTFVKDRDRREGQVLTRATIGHIIYKTYIEPREDLRYHAEKVKFYSTQYQAAVKHRSLLKEHRHTLQSEGNAGRIVRVNSLQLTPTFAPGAKPVQIGPPEDKDVESVVEELAGIVVLVDHVREDAQFARIELTKAIREDETLYADLSDASNMLYNAAGLPRHIVTRG